MSGAIAHRLIQFFNWSLIELTEADVSLIVINAILNPADESVCFAAAMVDHLAPAGRFRHRSSGAVQAVARS